MCENKWRSNIRVYIKNICNIKIKYKVYINGFESMTRIEITSKWESNKKRKS